MLNEKVPDIFCLLGLIFSSKRMETWGVGEDDRYQNLEKNRSTWICLELGLRNLCESHFHPCTQAQLCPTLCGPLDCSLPGSSVHGIFQARTLERAAISSSKESSWPKNWDCVSCIGRQILTTLPPGKSKSLLSEMETFPALPVLIAVLLVPAPQSWRLLMGCEEELKGLLMKVKEESEKLT